MKKDNKVWIIILASIYGILISFISIYIYQKLHSAGLCGINNLCIFKIPLYFFVPLVSSTGLIIGALMIYLLQEKEKEIVEIKTDEKEKIDKLLSKILSKKEKDILDLLKDGELSQSEIGKKLNLMRVETFRTIKRLEEKGLVRRNKIGKVVKIKRVEL